MLQTGNQWYKRIAVGWVERSETQRLHYQSATLPSVS